MNIHKGPYSAEEEEEEGGRRKEEGGGERRAPNKAGPKRPPLLNGIKFGCIVTIGIYYGLDQWLILSQGVGKGFLLEQVQDSRYTTNKVHTGFIKCIQGSYKNTKKKKKKKNARSI